MTPPLNESFDTSTELLKIFDTEFQKIPDMFQSNPRLIENIKEQVLFLFNIYEGLSDAQRINVNALFSFIENDLNSGDLSIEWYTSKITFISTRTQELKTEIERSIFRKIGDINISQWNWVLQTPLISTTVATPQAPVSQPSSGWMLEFFGGVVPDETSRTVPVVWTEVEAKTEVETVSTDIENIPTSIWALENYKIYLESIKGNYRGEDQVHIDSIIESINVLTTIMWHPNFEALLRTLDIGSQEQLFYNSFRKKLNSIKEIARQHEQWILFSDMIIENQTWNIKNVLDRLSTDLRWVLNVTQLALEAERNRQAPALDVPTKDVEVTREGLSTYQRVILDLTWLLPEQLADVDNFNIPEIVKWNTDGLPNIFDIWEDFRHSNYYWDTASKLQEVQSTNGKNSIIQLWLQTFLTDAEELAGVDILPFIPAQLESADFQRYLDEIWLGQLDAQIKQNAINDMNELAWDVSVMVWNYKEMLRLIQTGEDTNTMFEGEDMWNMEEKARAISTMLIFLEWVHNDLQSWPTILAFYAMNLAVAWYWISNTLGLEWLDALIATLIFSAPPLWFLTKLRAWKTLDSSQSMDRKYRTYLKNLNDGTTPDNFEDWVNSQKHNGQDLTPRQRIDAIRFNEHTNIINSLINELKSRSSEKSSTYIELLEKFKKSRYMNLPTHAWKMILEQELIVWRTGKLSWLRSWAHRFWRLNTRWWVDVLIRGQVMTRWFWSDTFDYKILKFLWLEWDFQNFEKLMSDSDIQLISRTIVNDTYKWNIDRYINNLGISDAEINSRKTLLNSYITAIPGNDPIPERVFLFTVREIADWRITNIAGTRDITVPNSFDTNAQDTARESFITIDEVQQEFNEKKSKVRTTIEWFSTDYDEVKTELLGELNKIHKADELKDFKNKFVNPIKDTINILEKTWFDSDIRNILKSEILAWLKLSDDTAKEARIKELTEKMPTIEKLLKEAAHERFNEGDLRKTIIQELKTIIEYKWDDFKNGITQLSWEITDTNTILKNISSIEDDFKNVFRDAIVDGLRAHDDGGQALKDAVKISGWVSWTLRSIDSLNVDNWIKANIKNELKSIISDANAIDFNNLKSGISNLAELNSLISWDTHSSIPSDTKTRLDAALSWNTVNWSEIWTLRTTTDRLLTEAQTIRAAEAGRPVMPGVSPNATVVPVEPTETVVTPAPEVVPTPEPTSEEIPRNSILTADWNLKQAYQSRFDRILFVYETTPPLKTTEELNTLSDRMREFSYDSDNRFISRNDFNAWLRWIAEIPTELKLPSMGEIRESRERKLAELYIERVELEYKLAWKEFDASLYPTSWVTNFSQFETTLQARLQSDDINEVRTLHTILWDANIEIPEFISPRDIELANMIRSWHRVTFREEIDFTRQLIRAIKSWG